MPTGGSELLVIDSGVLFRAAVGAGTGRLRDRLYRATTHAPYLVDVELGNVVRRYVRRGELPVRRAEVALQVGPLLVDERHAHTGAVARAAWQLRDNLTFYDAQYVALAARLGVSLLTTDARLARAPGLTCDVELLTPVG